MQDSAVSLGIGAVERILQLKRLPTLGTLPAEDLARVADLARERSFSRGAALLRAGELAGSIHYILDGRVEISVGGEALDLATTGTAVGALELLAKDSRGLAAVATEATYTLELEGDSLFELLEDHVSIPQHLLRETCGQLIELQTRNPPEAGGPFLSRFTPIASSSRDLDLVERIFFLRRAPPFRRSSINALAELSRGLSELRFEPGTRLFSAGDAAGGLMLLLNGSVACSIPGGARFELGPGSPLGAFESIAGRPRWYDAVTQTKVVALHGQVEGMMDVFEDNAEMAVDYLTVMCRWLLHGIARVPSFRASTIGALVNAEREPPQPESS